MSERKPGWYWVKQLDHPDPVYWEVAEIVQGLWYQGDQLIEWKPRVIGPRIPAPDEPWQCVPAEPTEGMLFKAETEAKHKEVDMSSLTPTEHPDDGGGPAGYYYRGLLAAAPKPGYNDEEGSP